MDAPELAPTTIVASSASASALPRSLVPTALLAGILAGVLAYLAGEATLQANRSGLGLIRKARPTPEDVYKQILVIATCASVTYGALGGTLGMALGLTGGLIRRSRRGAVLGAVVGLALGGGLGGLATRIITLNYYQKQNVDANDLILPLLTHGAIWSTVGLAAGLAFGVGLGPSRWKTAAVGGLAGAVLATLVYEVAGALAFPAARTDLPLSMTMTSRAMAHLLVASFVAAGAALTAGQTPAAPDRAMT